VGTGGGAGECFGGSQPRFDEKLQLTVKAHAVSEDRDGIGTGEQRNAGLVKSLGDAEHAGRSPGRSW